MKFFHVTYSMPYDSMVGSITIPAETKKAAYEAVKKIFSSEYIVNINAVVEL